MTAAKLSHLQIPVSKITVPESAVRIRKSAVDDDVLRKSIEAGGVQQPLVVIPTKEGYRLVKGSRRLAAARALGLARVPCIVDAVPEGDDIESYSLKIRFILDEHRQDLLPSQKAELIQRLKKSKHFSNAEMASYLGVDSDSITNWLSVLKYVPAVVSAMDAGRLTMQSARVFDGMSEEGQRHIWVNHESELVGEKKAGMHQRLRTKYSPQEYPAFYRNADLTAARLARKSAKTRKKDRQNYTAEEKKKLLTSYEVKESELRDIAEDIAQQKQRISACTPIVAAILRNKSLRAMVPTDMLPDLESFAESYC